MSEQRDLDEVFRSEPDALHAANKFASGNRNAYAVGNGFLAGILWERERLNSPAPSSPRLDSPEVREALEAGASLLRFAVADHEKVRGRDPQSDEIRRHARTLRAMASMQDGVASDADARDAGRWVPVTERLPEHSAFYEVTSSDPWPPCVYVLELRDAEWPEHAHWRVDGAFTGHVIAWRPLPPPYEPSAPPSASPSTAEKGEK